MKFIHSEVPNMEEDIIPRSTSEEIVIPLEDINKKFDSQELKSIPIYSEEELIQHPGFELKKLTSYQRKIVKLTRLLVKDIINFVVIGLISYLVFNFLKRNNILN